MRVGVIGGTGLYQLSEDAEQVRVETRYGARDVFISGDGDVQYVFLNRHGEHHATPPHQIDHRANILALAACHVEAVLAVYNAGGITERAPPGSFVVPDDFVDLHPREAGTFHDQDVSHVDLSYPYCARTRAAWLTGVRAAGAKPIDGGTYVAVRGPRLETPAEVRHLATLGDLVGMTGCPEAALAREAGLCYAGLAYVANPATTPGASLSAQAIRDAFAAQSERVLASIHGAARALASPADCGCADAPARARLEAV